jgi:hypothetical protein
LPSSEITVDKADGSCVPSQGLRILARSSEFRSGIYPAYFGNKKPIPSLWNRLNVSGIFGIIVQRVPQLANRHSKAAVKINERIVRPEAGSELLPADDFSGVFQERDEEPTRLLLLA